MLMDSTALRALRSGWWLVLLAVAGAVAGALVLSSHQEPVYRSSATYIVSPRQGDTTADITESVRTLDPDRARALVSTYAEVIASDAVQAEAAASLGYGPDLLDFYSAEAVVAPEAYVAELRVTGPDPDLAATLSTALGAAASARFTALYPIYDVVVLDPASVPTSPANRGPVETAVIAGLLGLVAGGALALLAGAPRLRRRRRLQQRLSPYSTPDTTVTPFPAERRTSRAG
jgi:uncharacterized protein involved in exopolysaccharide biosynthesis